jgi:hypothetical protein
VNLGSLKYKLVTSTNALKISSAFVKTNRKIGSFQTKIHRSRGVSKDKEKEASNGGGNSYLTSPSFP